MADLDDNEKIVLKHITSYVEKLEAELSDKDFPKGESNEERGEILNSRIKECDDLLKKLDDEKEEVSKTLDQIRDNLMHLKQDPEQQVKKLLQFEDELSIIVKDQNNMEEARQQVDCITPQQFAALKNLRRPPKVLEEVLIGIAYLFGVKPGESVRRRSFGKKTRKKKPAIIQWADAKRFIMQRETKEKILRFNPLTCEMEDIQKARSWIKEHAASFDMERIRRASGSFAPLAAWINLSMGLAVKYKHKMDLDVKRIMLTDKANEIRKQLAMSKKDTAYIDNMEKKVSDIYNKQIELEDCVGKLQQKLQKRRGNIPEKRRKRDSITLKRVETFREEYQTQIFFDWKTMMNDNKKKKKKKKGKKKKKEQSEEYEEVDLICKLTSSSKLNEPESESKEAARQKGRELYMMQKNSKSIRRTLTGFTGDGDSEIKIWVEGEGWVIPDEEKKDELSKTPSMKSVEEEKEHPRRRQKRSAIIMQGLIKHLRSESQLRECNAGNELMKFLGKIRARLDKIDLKLERQHSL